MDVICSSPVPFEEDRLWIDSIRPWLLANQAGPETLKIANYVVTEMLNNVRDHSGAPQVTVSGGANPKAVVMHVQDSGIGVFRRLAEGLGLANPREAVIEIAKGKRTTDPASHTGQGIFFSSRVCDWFCIEANGFAVSFEHGREPERLELVNAGSRSGTTVKFRVAREPDKTLREVFDEYCPQPDIEFVRTRIGLRLMAEADGSLVSRSQARRLMAGLEQFELVEFDFTAVTDVGQGFADEAFRVWRSAHPAVTVKVTNAGDEVLRMLRHIGYRS